MWKNIIALVALLISTEIVAWLFFLTYTNFETKLADIDSSKQEIKIKILEKRIAKMEAKNEYLLREVIRYQAKDEEKEKEDAALRRLRGLAK